MDTVAYDRSSQALRALHAYQIGGLPLLQPLLTALQVREIVNEVVPSQADVELGQLVVHLVLNRLLAPQPLYEIQGWLAETVLPEVLGIDPAQAYDNRFGRALDHLYPYLGELWRRLVSQAIVVYGLDVSILHWDITSVYFEGAYAASELVSYGYSSDQRPDRKQINLEVDVTHADAVPVLYEVLTGNTADDTRPLPHLTALLHFLARPELAAQQLRPLLVSDRKLITAEAVLACHQHQLYYLAPLADAGGVAAVLHSVSVASQINIMEYVSSLAVALSIRSIARNLSSLKVFYRFLVSDGKMETNPARLISYPELPRRLPGVLRGKEVERLLAAPDASTGRGLRDRAMMELLYASGLRVSELVGLRVANINLEAGWVRTIGKGSKERMVPMGSKAQQSLKDFLT